MSANKNKNVKAPDKAKRQVHVTKKQTHSASKRQVKAVKKNHWNFPYTKDNLIYALIGLGVIIIGFILMSTGVTEEPAVQDGTWNNPMAVTIAPMLLVIGYCILIPYAIMKFRPAKVSDSDGNS